MFSGAIALRYKMKKAGRPFRIGKGGNGLMWLIGGLGFCGSLLAFVLSFIPPSQISTGNNTVWFAVLFIGVIVVVAAPFIIYASKKASWVDPNTEFEPFHWEEQPAAQVAGKTITHIHLDNYLVRAAKILQLGLFRKNSTEYLRFIMCIIKM